MTNLGKEQEGHGVFEIKNVDGLIHKQQWTENEPPVQYIIQLQHYMYVLGYSWRCFNYVGQWQYYRGYYML